MTPRQTREEREIAAFRPILEVLEELEGLLPDFLGPGKPFAWSTSKGDRSAARKTAGRERAVCAAVELGGGWNEIRAFEDERGVLRFGAGADVRGDAASRSLPTTAEGAVVALLDILVKHEAPRADREVAP